MTNQEKEQLLKLLYQYSEELAKDCKYDCYNCGFGILESYSSGYSCALDVVVNNIELD